MNLSKSKKSTGFDKIHCLLNGHFLSSCKYVQITLTLKKKEYPPQGSVLSAILFSIFTADIPKPFATSNPTKILQYVDDLSLFTTTSP